MSIALVCEAGLSKYFYVRRDGLAKGITEIGKKAWLFAKLQPGRARKIINAT